MQHFVIGLAFVNLDDRRPSFARGTERSLVGSQGRGGDGKLVHVNLLGGIDFLIVWIWYLEFRWSILPVAARPCPRR